MGIAHVVQCWRATNAVSPDHTSISLSRSLTRGALAGAQGGASLFRAVLAGACMVSAVVYLAAGLDRAGVVQVVFGIPPIGLGVGIITAVAGWYIGSIAGALLGTAVGGMIGAVVGLMSGRRDWDTIERHSKMAVVAATGGAAVGATAYGLVGGSLGVLVALGAILIWSPVRGFDGSALSFDSDSVTPILRPIALFLERKQGKYADGVGLLRRYLASTERAYLWSPYHYEIGSRLDELAELYCVQGKYAEAEPLLKRALEIWDKYRSKEIASTVARYAQLLRNTNRGAEATKVLARLTNTESVSSIGSDSRR